MDIDKLRRELDSWSTDDIVPGDLAALCAEASAELARLHAPAGDELPDDLRAPLHSLQADREYLVARIRKADDEEAGLLSESIRNRLSQIEEAAYRLNGRLRAPVEGEVGVVVRDLEAASDDLMQRTYSDRCDSPRCAIASNVATRAADLLQRLTGQVKTVLNREAATTARYDAKLDAAEAMLREAVGRLDPFARISSEGVIKAETGHITVTTCAEYFHEAAAFLTKLKDQSNG